MSILVSSKIQHLLGYIVEIKITSSHHIKTENTLFLQNEGYELNYAAVTLRPQAKREEREELEPHVIYAATR